MTSAAYPGAVFHHPHFEFRDGAIGNKLFVVLTNGSCGHFVVARTTTVEKFRSRDRGCNLDDRNPNYFILSRESGLDDDSWICLDYLTDFDKPGLERRVANGEIHNISRISGELLLDIVRCAAYADDTTKAQETELNKLLKR